MNDDLPSKTQSPAEPASTTGEKPSIGKTHEEFIGDEAAPSLDKSEYEARSKGGHSGGAQQKSGPAQDAK